MIPSKSIFRILITGLFFTLILTSIVQPADLQSGSGLPYQHSAFSEGSFPLIYSPLLLSFTENIMDYYESSGLKVKILVIVVLYLLVSIISLFLIIMINRWQKTKKRQHAEKMKNVYNEELTNFLYDEDNKSFNFTEINNPDNRNIFINQLLSLHNNIHGETAVQLRDLYFNLGLYNDSLKKLRKKRWDRKAKGIREVAQMDVKEAIKDISVHVNSKNQILRTEAQVALVKLIDDDPLNFLDNLKYDLSPWEQIKIYDTLEYHQIYIDSFQRWFNSDNESVVNFAIKMTGLYKHNHAAADLIPFLENENADVRYNSIEALGRMEMPENMEHLKEAFLREQAVEPRENNAFYHLNINRNRKAVLKAISRIATTEEIGFLSFVLENEPDFETRVLAAKTLASTGPQGINQLDKLLENSSPRLSRIIENVKLNLV